MKIYSKIVNKIRNNKQKLKKVSGIGMMALGFRYRSINPIPINPNLSLNSIQQIEKVENTSGKRNLNNKSSSNLVQTNSRVVIEVQMSVPPSKALESTLQIRSGNIEGVDGFGINVNPPMNRPTSNKSKSLQTFGAKTSLNNDSPNSSDSDSEDDNTCSDPDYNSEYSDQLFSEMFDNVDSSSVSSFNNSNDPISEIPELSLDYEISDSDEIYDEEPNNSDDKQIYLNNTAPGYKSAIKDDYTDSVFEYKYSTSPDRFERFLRREAYANKKEHELFNKDRTQDDLTRASKTNIPDRRLKEKLWRHPAFFDLIKPKSRSKTPKEDFFKQHGKDAKRQLREHLLSPHTRCFKNGVYREHDQPYDFYYNNQTGKLLIVKTNGETGEQEIFSFWTISKMQRLELLNHNHVHKHWKLVEALQEKEIEEKALIQTKNAKKHEENRSNQAISRVEAARRAGEQIKKNIEKDSKTSNDT